MVFEGVDRAESRVSMHRVALRSCMNACTEEGHLIVLQRMDQIVNDY